MGILQRPAYAGCIGLARRELGGVAAVAALLRAALAARPAVKELPRSEEAAHAASTAVHALAVLLADCRANRGRLRDTGAVPLLVNFSLAVSPCLAGPAACIAECLTGPLPLCLMEA